MSEGEAGYRALTQRVDAFGAAVTARRAPDVACRAGCTGCCRVALTVSAVEAAAIGRHLATLGEPTRRRLGARAARATGDECVMLDGGRCAIYAARPLVCRTQGLPLAYDATGSGEPDASGAESDRSVSWCPLNFVASPPDGADVLDATRVDEMLAIVNRLWAESRGVDPLARTPLVDLARGGPGLDRTAGDGD